MTSALGIEQAAKPLRPPPISRIRGRPAIAELSAGATRWMARIFSR